MHSWVNRLKKYLRGNRQHTIFSRNIWQDGAPVEGPDSMVFMAINRTASSSMFTWLEAHHVDYCMSRYRESDKLKYALIERIKAHDLTAFTVVRNPWDRAVSCWKHCLAKKDLAPCTFKEFLHMPREEMTPQQRFHSGPQWPHVVDRDGMVSYLSHVGRFEDLNTTCKWVSDAMGFEPKHHLQQLNRSDRGHYAQYYDSEIIQKVAQDFSRDIEMFDYTFND